MTQHWNVRKGFLEISEMPFYWRLTEAPGAHPAIPARLPFRVRSNDEFDYLQYEPNDIEWRAIDAAYRQNENIGFLNPESGQIKTYGSSVNKFFNDVITAHSPRRIYEIGCGAGFSIQFLKENGWSVTGIDPSEYSLQWSERLGFALLNEFFDGDLLAGEADLIFCNDVFEHVRDVENFSRDVWKSLADGGVFCFATTNSSQSIAIGDISMFEHQHVNMFTERAIHLILSAAGFIDIKVGAGSYGNTFHVVARKGHMGKIFSGAPVATCAGFLDRAQEKLEAFQKFYFSASNRCQYYVPLRCIPYLAAVGDFGSRYLFDSNSSWRGKYIDGYDKVLKSIEDLNKVGGDLFFIGSLTFHKEIRKTLVEHGYRDQDVFSISNMNLLS